MANQKMDGQMRRPERATTLLVVRARASEGPRTGPAA